MPQTLTMPNIKEQTTQRSLWRRVETGSREMHLFRFLLEMKFATAQQIWQRFYKKEKSPEAPATYAWKWVEKRLRKLCWAGYVHTARSHTFPHQLYLATPKAKALLEQNSVPCMGLPALTGVDFKTFEHDLALVELRLILEPRGWTWYSERELRATLHTLPIPDAVIEQHRERMAVEMELSQKRRDRYLRLFQEYARKSPWNHILYFTSNSTLAEYLLEIARDMGMSAIFAGTEPGKNPGPASPITLKNYLGKEITL